jgi:hypothetical protein
MTTKTLRDACSKAYDGLTRESPWTGGVVIIREDDGNFDAIPGAFLTDCSYTGSRNVVTEWNSIYDIMALDGDIADYSKSDVVDWMMDGIE